MIGDIPLPAHWPGEIKSALLRAAAIAHRIAVASRGWAANSRIASVRAKAEANAATSELALLRQEIAIRDARSSRVPPKHRLHYTPEERLLILALRAAGGWTAHETARRFQVTAATISSWTTRAEGADDALLATRAPVNKIPDFVALVVEHVKIAGQRSGAGASRTCSRAPASPSPPAPCAVVSSAAASGPRPSPTIRSHPPRQSLHPARPGASTRSAPTTSGP